MRIVSINVHYQDGLGYQDYYLGKALKKMGHEVYFVTSDWHFRFPDYENTVQHIIGDRHVGPGVFINDYGCEVHRLKSVLINGMYWLKGFSKKLTELKPDLIISHGVFTFQSVRLSFFGSKLNCPIIYDDHTTSTFFRTDLVSRAIFWTYRLLFAKQIYKSAAKIVGISNSCIPVLRDVFGLKGDKVIMVSLGADTDTYFPDDRAGELYRKELNINEEDTLIVYTGKIYDTKRLHTIFDVLNAIEAPTDKNIIFHVVGDIAKEYQVIFSECAEKFKHKLIYRKAVNQDTLANIYNAADFCIWLDFTNSTIEASACGCPVIVTDLMPERIVSKWDISVNRDNSIEIIKAVNRLLSKKLTGEDLINFEGLTNSLSWRSHASKFLI